MGSKLYNISYAETENLQNCSISSTGEFFYVVPEWKTNTSNSTVYQLNADDPISLHGYLVDENYILVASWNYGFAVHKLDSNGTGSNVYHDLTPNNSYQRYTSIAIDKTRKVAYIGNYIYDNLRKYDFNGDWENTPTSSILTQGANGLPSDEVGYSYRNGLAIAGDWLYISPDDTAFSNVKRWNTQTETVEDLVRTGSVNNIMRGGWYYHEPSDRLFHSAYTSAASFLTCVISASSDTNASAKTIRWDSAGFSTGYSRPFGIFVDNANDNHIWICGYYTMGKIDITKCMLDPSDPSYTNQATRLLPNDTPIRHDVDGRRRLLNHYGGLVSHPDVNCIWVAGGGGRVDHLYGFVDTEDGMVVAIPDNSLVKTSTSQFGPQYGQGYQKIIFPSSSYWINYGYGNEGSRLRVWNADEVAPELFESWSFETTTEQMDDASNITELQIIDLDIEIPPNSSLTIQVSNTNGSIWENYSGVGDKHTFESTGNQAKIKISANGSTSSSPRIISKDFIVMITNNIPLVRPINRRNRTQGFKLKGS